MLRHKSAQKRAKQNNVRSVRNHSYKTRIASATKKILALAEAGNKDEAVAAFKASQALIDGAKTKGVLHKKTVARRVSRIARTIAKIA